MPRFSIIIPVKALNEYVRETVSHILLLQQNDWELIILPNDPSSGDWEDRRIKVIPSGNVGPAAKRDLGAKLARGEFLVFLDDDSYPDRDLLDIAVEFFRDTSVVALGGPGVTPTQDNFWQRVSGAVFLSKYSGGAPERYVPVGDVRVVEDWPSVNFMVRKDAFIEVGGFNSEFWPGEDTKFCLSLIEKTRRKILYIPHMRVWHHRRAGLFGHLKQVGAYGLHRGYFARVLPATSRRIIYFLPSLFFLFSLSSFFVFFMFQKLQILFALGWFIYSLAMLKAWKDIRRYESPLVASAAMVFTVLTHYYYGMNFLYGLFSPRLKSRLR